ncbi:hypothetical protein [Dysgonomonas capnocytophagoides]|uniref:hypothetical protein n=1 Tax=Dysgonomonas capnocytophagoides TaxID=45254 RepID=UPI002A7F8DB9|nr:hypothetical protein [Dysgonomonas capnocytophagoides]
MNMYVDDETGYVIMDDIQEGFDILPSELYQSYLKQIKDQQEQIVALQEKVADLQDKLANIAVAQAEAAQNFAEVSKMAVEDARRAGFAIGLFCKEPKSYKSDYAYFTDIKQFLLCDSSDFSEPPTDSKRLNDVKIE